MAEERIGEAGEPSVANDGSPPVEGYRGPHVCRIIGISYRQLDYWARTGLLRPSVVDATGSGSKRVYSYRDLVELKVIKGLLDAGVSLQSARRAVEYLRESMGEDMASASLVLNGSDSVLVRNDGELIDLVRQGQGVLSIVALGGVIDELAAAITELPTGESAPAPNRHHPSLNGSSTPKEAPAGAMGGAGGEG